MKKYGYNWLYATLGMFLTVGVTSIYWRYMSGCLRPPKRPRTLDDVLLWGVLDAAGWTLIWFFAERLQYKRRQEAIEATEDNPVKSKDTVSTQTSKSLTTRQLLISAFGFGSCYAGPLSLLAHLWRGNVSAVQVVAYTVAVPSLVMLGAWLIHKAKLPDAAREQREYNVCFTTVTAERRG